MLVLVVLFWASAVPGAELVFDFKKAKLHEVPTGFVSTLAGEGTLGDWQVVEDIVPSVLPPVSPRAPSGYKRLVLAQLSEDRTDEHFPMLIYKESTFGDFTLTTRFKIVSGRVEQMAGIAFRVQDEKNYYYIRASALASNLTFFKVVDGRRVSHLGDKAEVKKGVWQELRIECKGTRIQASLDGKEILPRFDDATFARGKIGYWTKSDSVSYFVDTVIDYKPLRTLAETLVQEAYKRYSRLLGLEVYAPKQEAGELHIAASLDPEQVGKPAPKEVEEILTKRGYFYGKGKGKVAVTLPLHDRNGDSVAAVRVVMKSFPGQTKKNALARAMPVVQGMERRILKWTDLTE
jgi:hypothetical protein